MKRLVWGIIVAAAGLLVLVSPERDPEEAGRSIIMGLLCLSGGGILIFFGSRYLKRKKIVTEFALQMLREDGKIDTGELAQRLGLSEVHVRSYIAESKRKGIIPFKADVV